MKNLFLMLLGVVLIFSACDPVIESKIDIGSAPSASFEFTKIDENNYTFTNTSADEHFIMNWSIPGVSGFTADTPVIDVNFLNAGDYDVTLSVFGKGGSGTVTQTITITQDDPSACDPLIEFLANCASKNWKLSPQEGALFVGPGDGTIWWQNTPGDVTTRSCHWNDVYTFTKDGEFTYNSNGDLWGETFIGFGSDGCYPIGDLAGLGKEAWGDGNHTYTITPANGSNPATLKVEGLGAFIGLRKAANGAEVSDPQSEVTYEIVDLTADRLEIQVNFGPGFWKFILVPE